MATPADPPRREREINRHIRTALISLSVALNIVVAIPALLLLVRSSGIQFEIYQKILAPRLGKPVIVFLGDSITLGGNLWGLRIGEMNFDTWNYGHGGLTTRQPQHYGHLAAGLKSVRYAFIMAGTNDPDKTRQGAESTFQDYKVILDTLRKAGITPIIQSTLYRTNDASPQFATRLNALLTDYAARHHLRTIDLNPILAPRAPCSPGTHRMACT